jgi:hypothetical protein
VLVDTNAFARTYDQQQWAHAFGGTQLAARTNPETLGFAAIYKWFSGTPAPAADSIGTIQPNAALFFAVAQAVGPNLTPATWKAALYNAPGTKAAISQPFISWGGKLWPEPDYQDKTTQPRSGGTRRPPAQTRFGSKAPACTSSSMAASATSPVRGPRKKSCSTPQGQSRFTSRLRQATNRRRIRAPHQSRPAWPCLHLFLQRDHTPY